jgi:hypothetical protein
MYDFQATNRREGGDTSCRGCSREAPGLHLERARDSAGGSRTAWRADYWWGECPAWRWWWTDLLKSYKPSQPYEIAKNGKKTGSFAHVFAYISPKTPFFAIKYLTRYTHETFFEEYINYKIFRNSSHYGVIPVRSFGSHICPQPHGLGI